MMMLKKIYTISLGLVLLLPACSNDALWPSLTEEQSFNNEKKNAERQQVPIDTALPQFGTGTFEPKGVTSGEPTGTYVGEKIIKIRGELSQLQASLSQHNEQLQIIRSGTMAKAQQFQNTLAAINTRLQIGTTPGNPVLIQKYNSALVDLDEITNDLAKMNVLFQKMATDSTMSNYLSESIQAAFRLSGAVDEDHRQLAVLEDENAKISVLVKRLHKELAGDIRRGTAYMRTARMNLNNLSTSINAGEIVGASAFRYQTTEANLSENAHPINIKGRNPLLVIRFDHANVSYQKALRKVVTRVLKQHPMAVFDVVAVTPASSNVKQATLDTTKSRHKAESVLRSLINNMEVSPDRVAISAQTSNTARFNEVHLYTR